MKSNVERRLSLSVEPDKLQVDLQDKWKRLLNERQFSYDLTSDSAQRSLLHAESLTGTAWYPGYYEKWFFNGFGYKEHETYVGFDESMGYVCISILFNSPIILGQPEPTCTRALVRSKMGFLGVIISNQLDSSNFSGHNRSFSMSRKVSKSGTTKPFLKEIFYQYLDQLKRVGSKISPYKDASLDSLASSRSSLSEADMALKRWMMSKDMNVLDNIPIDRLVNSLVLAPFPAICRKLHDLERPSKCATYEIDLVRVDNGDFSPLWTKFLSSIGTPFSSKPKESSSMETIKSCNKTAEERRKKQALIIAELIETESNYLDHLKGLDEIYIRNLKSMGILTKAELSIIFVKIPELIKLHSDFLRDLENEIKRSFHIFKIAEAFFEKAEKIYQYYVGSYEQMSSKCAECLENNKKFYDYANEASKSKKCGRLHIKDLQIEPVQRMPRYELILKGIAENTTEEDSTYESLESARTKIKSVNASINKYKKFQDNSANLFNIVSEVENCPPNVIKSGRTLIGVYEAVEFDFAEKEIHKPVLLYLMSDVLLIARNKQKVQITGSKSKSTKKFEGIYELTKLNLISLKEMGFDDGFQLEVEISNKKENVIKLGEDSLSSERKFRKSELNLRSALSINLSDEEPMRSTFTYKSSRAVAFITEFRNALDKLQPRVFTSLGRVYRKWTDYNAEFLFHAFDDWKSYENSDKRNRVALLFIEEKKANAVATHLDADIVCLIFAESGRFRTIVRANENAIRSNPSAVKKHHVIVKENWWKRLEDGFIDSFLVRMKRLGDIIKFNDHEYQLLETERIRSRLQGIVSSHVPHYQHSNIISNMINSASFLSKNYTELSKSISKPRSRKNSISSLSDNLHGSSGYLRNSTDTGIFSAGSTIPSAYNSNISLSQTVSQSNKLSRRHSSIFELTQTFSKKLSPLKNMSPLRNTAVEESNIIFLFKFIEENCLDTDKIYEIAAPPNSIDHLYKMLNSKILEFSDLENCNPHVITNTIHNWVRNNRNKVWSTILTKFWQADFDQLQELHVKQGVLRSLILHLKTVSDNKDLNFMSTEKLSQIWGPVLFNSFSWQTGYKEKSIDLFRWMLNNSDIICRREARLSVQSMPNIEADKAPVKQLPSRHSWDACMDPSFGTSPKPKKSSYRASLDSIYEDIQPLEESTAVSNSMHTIPKYPTKKYDQASTMKIPRKPVHLNEKVEDIFDLYANSGKK